MHFIERNLQILNQISMKFVPYGPINIQPALVQILAWHQTGDKPLYEPMMVYFIAAYVCYSASMGYIKKNIVCQHFKLQQQHELTH